MIDVRGWETQTNCGWQVYIQKCSRSIFGNSLPISDDQLVETLNCKYGPDMWLQYWKRHLECHHEKGKSKCDQTAAPCIELILDNWDESSRTLRLRAWLQAKGRRWKNTCTQYCGVLKLTFPTREELLAQLSSALDDCRLGFTKRLLVEYCLDT